MSKRLYENDGLEGAHVSESHKDLRVTFTATQLHACIADQPSCCRAKRSSLQFCERWVVW